PRREGARPGRGVAPLAAQADRDVWDFAYDVLLRNDGREFLLLPLLNYNDESYQGLFNLMNDPYTVQGLGDGGAHCGVVCDASMTTYLLTHWTRDRTRGPRLGLEPTVRRMTHDTAALYGFADRGVVAPGMR